MASQTGAGVTIVTRKELTKMVSRDTFSLRDPEGNAWTIGTYRGAP